MWAGPTISVNVCSCTFLPRSCRHRLCEFIGECRAAAPHSSVAHFVCLAAVSQPSSAAIDSCSLAYCEAMSVSKELKHSVQKLIDEANVSGKLVAGWELTCKDLIEMGLAVEQTLPPEHVRIHPGNRAGEGVNPEKAHKVGARIARLGFSKARAAGATCFEAPADPTKHNEYDKANDIICELSNGMCPPWVTKGKYYSVGGSHLNVFIRGVNHSAPTSHPDLADGSGNIAKDQLFLDTLLKDACEHGLRWLVISRVAEEEWPDLPDFIQRTLNSDAKEQQSEIEIIQRLSP